MAFENILEILANRNNNFKDNRVWPLQVRNTLGTLFAGLFAVWCSEALSANTDSRDV